MIDNTPLSPQQKLDLAQQQHDLAMALNRWGEHPAVQAVGAFSGGAMNAVIDPVRYGAHMLNSLAKWGQLQSPGQAETMAQRIDQQAARPGILPDSFNDSRQQAMQRYPELATAGELGMGSGIIGKTLPVMTTMGGARMALPRSFTAGGMIEGGNETLVEPALNRAFNQAKK